MRDLTKAPAGQVAAERARVRDLDFDMDEREGRPSHWNTLRAMRVLDWFEGRGVPYKAPRK